MTDLWHNPATILFEGRAVAYGMLGNGPPLVLIHGTPFSSLVWRRIAPLLARGRQVYFFDLLGYGRSDCQPGDVSLGVQNRLLAAMLKHWQLDQPDVVAHDFGGATALRAHLLDGCDYRSLTLIDPVALAPWGSPFVHHVRAYAPAFSGLPATFHDALLAAYIDGACYRPLDDRTLSLYTTPWTGAIGAAAFYAQIAQMDQRYTDDIADRLSAVRCPVQILWGEEDRWLPITQGRQLAGLIPGAAFIPVPKAGHLVQEDAPEAIIAALAAFL